MRRDVREPELPVPLACSLSSEAMADRVEELDTLFRRALLGADRDGTTLRLRVAREAAEPMERLVELERRCCPFLRIGTRDAGGHLEIEIAGPDGTQAVIDGFDELAARALRR